MIKLNPNILSYFKLIDKSTKNSMRTITDINEFIVKLNEIIKKCEPKDEKVAIAEPVKSIEKDKANKSEFFDRLDKSIEKYKGDKKEFFNKFEELIKKYETQSREDIRAGYFLYQILKDIPKDIEKYTKKNYLFTSMLTIYAIIEYLNGNSNNDGNVIVKNNNSTRIFIFSDAEEDYLEILSRDKGKLITYIKLDKLTVFQDGKVVEYRLNYLKFDLMITSNVLQIYKFEVTKSKSLFDVKTNQCFRDKVKDIFNDDFIGLAKLQIMQDKSLQEKIKQNKAVKKHIIKVYDTEVGIDVESIDDVILNLFGLQVNTFCNNAV